MNSHLLFELAYYMNSHRFILETEIMNEIKGNDFQTDYCLHKPTTRDGTGN